MTSTTYPSRILTVLDVPEPKNFSATFHYNFFVTNESVDDSGTKFLSKGDSGDYARFIEITYSPVHVTEYSTGQTSKSPTEALGFDPSTILTPENLDKIQTEQSFSNFDFASINFQDTDLASKLYTIVSGAIALRGISEGSLADAADILSSLTSDNVDNTVIINGATTFHQCINFSTSDGTEVIRGIFDDLLTVQTHTQVNNKVVGSLVKRSSEDPLNPYFNEMAAILSSAESLQSDALSNSKAGSISSLEWDTGFVPISTTSDASVAAGSTKVSSSPVSSVSSLTGDSTSLLPTSITSLTSKITNLSTSKDVVATSDTSSNVDTRILAVIGYVIDKQEDIGSETIVHDPVILQGQDVGYYLDPYVKYGSVYTYTVRSIAIAQLSMVDSDGETVIATGLVSSNAAKAVTVTCTDNVPPPWPADFKVMWDYTRSAPLLTWSFPITSQQDVKRFQVFRRLDTDSPFELLREYNFDDSVVKISSNESISSDLEFVIDDPILFFVDDEFTKDSEYIYALCAIDAHGLSSSYTTQFKVSFDKFGNKIKVSRVCASGCPKSFPNMFLEEDTFVDTIKVSGYSRMSVYFDPEYLKVTNDAGDDLKLLPLNDPSAAYKINVINTDFQSSNVLHISVNDLLST